MSWWQRLARRCPTSSSSRKHGPCRSNCSRSPPQSELRLPLPFSPRCRARQAPSPPRRTSAARPSSSIRRREGRSRRLARAEGEVVAAMDVNASRCGKPRRQSEGSCPCCSMRRSCTDPRFPSTASRHLPGWHRHAPTCPTARRPQAGRQELLRRRRDRGASLPSTERYRPHWLEQPTFRRSASGSAGRCWPCARLSRCSCCTWHIRRRRSRCSGSSCYRRCSAPGIEYQCQRLGPRRRSIASRTTWSSRQWPCTCRRPAPRK